MNFNEHKWQGAKIISIYTNIERDKTNIVMEILRIDGMMDTMCFYNVYSFEINCSTNSFMSNQTLRYAYEYHNPHNKIQKIYADMRGHCMVPLCYYFFDMGQTENIGIVAEKYSFEKSHKIE